MILSRSFISLMLMFPIVLALGCSNEPGAGTNMTTAAEVDGNSYLIRNADLVLTMDPSLGSGILGTIQNADVLIVHDKIAGVGPGLSAHGARVIDGEGTIVMPGINDIHDHGWEAIIRGCGADAAVISWLDRCVLPLIGSPLFTEKDAYAAVRLSTTGLINTGVTLVGDWSDNFTDSFTKGNLRALNDSGLRYHFAMFGAALDGSDIRAAKEQYIDPNPLGTLQVASYPGLSFQEHLTAMTALAQSLGVKLHLHLLEEAAQAADDPFGSMAAANTLALGHNLLFAHAIHLTDAQIALIASSGASVSHQPLSNMRLASGIMRLPDIKNAGIDIGLGLDGATNDYPDAFANMRAAVGLQRAKTLDPHGSPTVAEVLRMATMGGAEVLDIDDQVGSLTPGKQADVIIFKTNTLNFAPKMNVINQIVFNGNPDNVTWVFVAGRPLKKNGTIVGVNIPKLLADAQVAADHIAPALDP